MSNVHPDEAVRTRAEQAEQDASRLDTEIGLDRDVFDVLAAIDPEDLDEDARRVHALAMRDFHRAGVDQPEEVRGRLRALAERETAVGQEFSKNIRDGVRSVSVAPSRSRRAARRLRREPPGRTRTAGSWSPPTTRTSCRS